jgi:hypothetical protein
MDRECITHWREEQFSKILALKSNRRDYLKDLDVDGRMILNWILKK